MLTSHLGSGLVCKGACWSGAISADVRRQILGVRGETEPRPDTRIPPTRDFGPLTSDLGFRAWGFGLEKNAPENRECR